MYKMRVKELRLKWELANRSWFVTENMTSATPDNAVGTTFKNVAVNETGEFVVQSASSNEISRIHLDSWTLVTWWIYPSYNWIFSAADAYISAELPAPYVLLTLSEAKIILHKDVARTTIIIELKKNWTTFQTFTLPTGTSTLTVPNTTTFVDSDKLSVFINTWVALSTIGAEIFLTYKLS